MKELFLRKPVLSDEMNYLDFISDMGPDEDITPGQARLRGKSFPEFISYLEDMSQGICEKGLVPSTLYILVDSDDYIYGAIDFRHHLNDYLLKYGGHFGYGIRISERRKGYGKLILKLGLNLVKEKGYESILITCDDDNHLSRLVILSNHGVYEDRIYKRDGYIRRYWIPLKEDSIKRKKLIFIRGEMKTFKTRISYRLGQEIGIPVVSYDEMLETCADTEVVYQIKQLEHVKTNAWHVIKTQLNRLFNSVEHVIFEGKISQEEVRELEDLMREKNVDIITVYFYGPIPYLHERYDDQYQDMHPVHKINKRLSLSDMQRIQQTFHDHVDMSFVMIDFTEKQYQSCKSQLIHLLNEKTS